MCRQTIRSVAKFSAENSLLGDSVDDRYWAGIDGQGRSRLWLMDCLSVTCRLEVGSGVMAPCEAFMRVPPGR